MTAPPSARTRGFLFADLRGYTEYVETHGDREAAELLAAYRDLVRTAVAAHEGAEIRTEGDSFYLVFPAVGEAVSCGLEVAERADEATAAHPERPVRVGVGVHAGETVETAEGFVGSAVNIAARVCSQAKAGEVLVTETVRSLTRTSLDVSFEARGTPRLKGLAEPVALYAVRSGAAYPASTTAPARNPYKGLRSFGEDDRADFFGRDALTDHLVDRLGQVSRAGRLLTVVGPSGSGKSSVVRAGLLPALRAGALPGSEAWRIAVMFPGARPFEELAAALRQVAAEPPAGLAEDLERDGDLGRAVTQVLSPTADERLLLVIDQFEELFTVVRDEGVRTRFLEALHGALVADHGRLLCVIALRADFLDRPLLAPDFGELVRGGMEAVTPLSRDELEAAITRPAQAVGLELEPGLAADVIADVVRQPGALPQLQYALTELFERSDGRRLSRDTYAAIGGVLGALGRRAEEIYASLDPEARELARQVLLRLVAPGEGTEATGRRVPTPELSSLSEDPGRFTEVIDRFGRWRLLSFDRDAVSREPTVEIAHEALLSRWPRLAGWVEEDREDLWMRRRLADAAAEWSRADQDPSFLLSGSRLELFEGWAASTDLKLSPGEAGYLEASLSERQRRRKEDEARAAHERSLERRSATRLRALVLVFASAALVAGGLLVVVFNQARTAQQQEKAAREQGVIATANGLAAASVGNLGTDPSLSLLLAVEAARTTADRGYVTAEAMDALHWALQQSQVAYPLKDGPSATRVGPGGQRGIYLLPPGELVKLAADHAGRALTAEECRTYLHRDTCPAEGASQIATQDLAVHTSSGTVPMASLASESLAGTSVRVVSQLPADLGSLLSSFESQSGIQAIFGDGDTASLGTLPAGQLPDIAILSRPADVATLAKQGRLIDLGTSLDSAQLRADLGSYLPSLGTLGSDGSWPAASGSLYGVPLAASLGGLVWYSPAAFEKAGYTVPKSWDELLALSQQMVKDGRTPWCMGFEAGANSGSAAADWVESLVLRGLGPAIYDGWALTNGPGTSSVLGLSKIPFDDIRTWPAYERFGKVAFGDGFVLGGPGSVALIPERLAALPLEQDLDLPSCWLYLGRGTDRQTWPAALSGAVAAFPLPAPDQRFSDAMIGQTYTVVAFHDRPEVRELVRHLLGDGFATELAKAPGAVGLLPARPVDPSLVRDEVDRSQAGLLREALQGGSFRAAASDLMWPTRFSQGLSDYVAAGKADVGPDLGYVFSGAETDSGSATTSPSETLQGTVTYDGKTCTYQGPLVVASGTSLRVDVVDTRGALTGAVILPARSGTTWDDVLKAQEAKQIRLREVSNSTGPMVTSRPDWLGGGNQTESGFAVLNRQVLGSALYDRYLVLCTLHDSDVPSAATLIRVATPPSTPAPTPSPTPASTTGPATAPTAEPTAASTSP
jgi:class 3 adenylate cyclase